MRGEHHPPAPTTDTAEAPAREVVHRLWGDHDHLPPDGSGAWLYVADVATIEHGPMRGAWLPAHLDATQAAMAVGSIIGESIARCDLVVIDQVGHGDEMVDEDHFVPEDHR